MTPSHKSTVFMSRPHKFFKKPTMQLVNTKSAALRTQNKKCKRRDLGDEAGIARCIVKKKE
jgi:hypothetical protein